MLRVLLMRSYVGEMMLFELDIVQLVKAKPVAFKFESWTSNPPKKKASSYMALFRYFAMRVSWYLRCLASGHQFFMVFGSVCLLGTGGKGCQFLGTLLQRECRTSTEPGYFVSCVNIPRRNVVVTHFPTVSNMFGAWKNALEWYVDGDGARDYHSACFDSILFKRTFCSKITARFILESDDLAYLQFLEHYREHPLLAFIVLQAKYVRVILYSRRHLVPSISRNHSERLFYCL